MPYYKSLSLQYLRIESIRFVDNIINHLWFNLAEFIHSCNTTIVFYPLQDQAHDIDTGRKKKRHQLLIQQILLLQYKIIGLGNLA